MKTRIAAVIIMATAASICAAGEGIGPTKPASPLAEPAIGAVTRWIGSVAADTRLGLGARAAIAVLGVQGRAGAISLIGNAAILGPQPASAVATLERLAKDRSTYANRHYYDRENTGRWDRKKTEAAQALKTLRRVSTEANDPAARALASKAYQQAVDLLLKTNPFNHNHYYVGTPSAHRALNTLVEAGADEAVPRLEMIAGDRDYPLSQEVSAYGAKSMLEKLGTLQAKAALARVSERELQREQSRYRDYVPPPRARDSMGRSDFEVATSRSEPFWTREKALDRMHPNDAEFWSKNDPSLPFWVRERFSRNRR